MIKVRRGLVIWILMVGEEGATYMNRFDAMVVVDCVHRHDSGVGGIRWSSIVGSMTNEQGSIARACFTI